MNRLTSLIKRLRLQLLNNLEENCSDMFSTVALKHFMYNNYNI